MSLLATLQAPVFGLLILLFLFGLLLPGIEAQDITNNAAAAVPTYDLMKDFGATGGNVVADTLAFQSASTRINGVKAAVLNIPNAKYIVSGQRLRKSPDRSKPFYAYDGVFSVTGLSALSINGNGATVQLASGLRFGAFANDTGANWTTITSHKSMFAAVGPIFQVWNSTKVAINNLNIDGNSANLILGGEFGDTGRQIGGSGIVLDGCPGAKITSCTARNCALDGFTVRQSNLKDPVYNPVVLDNVVSQYNARQGLSWIGGNGLTILNSEFSYTGKRVNIGQKMAFMSAPGAGFDIEPNGVKHGHDPIPQWTRNGKVRNTVFKENAGVALLAAFNRVYPGDSSDGGYTHFDKCNFSSTSRIQATFVQQPGISFYDCTFIGMTDMASDGLQLNGQRDPALATTFTRCTWNEPPTRMSSYMARVDGGAGATWTNCTFNSLKGRSVFLNITKAYANPKRFAMKGGKVVHGKAFTGTSMVASFVGVEFSNGNNFTETPELSASNLTYNLFRNDVVVGDTKILDSSGQKTSARVKWWPRL